MISHTDFSANRISISTLFLYYFYGNYNEWFLYLKKKCLIVVDLCFNFSENTSSE